MRSPGSGCHIRSATSRAGWRFTPTVGHSRTCAGATARRRICASGSVQKLGRHKLPNGEDPLKIDVNLQAQEPSVQRRAQRCASASLEEELAHDQSVGSQRRRGRSARRAISARTHSNRDRTAARVKCATRGRSRSPQPGIDPGGTIDSRWKTFTAGLSSTTAR